MKGITTWIVIADGARARIVAHNGPGKGFEALENMVFEVDHPPSREIDADRPGRTFDSGGSGRHGKASPTDAHDQIEQRFAADLAATLATSAAAGTYDRLILVADPTTLGRLRTQLEPAVAAKVMGELAKDLTHTPNDKLAPHLEDLLVP